MIEGAASFGEGFIEVSKRFEMPIDDRLVEEGPEALGGLQLRGVWRQEDKAHAIGDLKPRLAVPAGVVEDENDAAPALRADALSEVGQELFEERLADAVREIPNRFAARRLNEGGDVEPLIAMVAQRQGTLAYGRPDAATNRLQAEAMLVGRPDFDRLIGMPLGLLRRDVGKLFLKADSSSALAALGFLGRGD